jgi:uncharacterized protein (TIGR00251 family)
MSIPAFLQDRGGDAILAVKATPRASRNEIGEALGAELKIKIAAPPVDSAANDELAAFLAKTLGCPKSSVQIIRGKSSRHKVVLISGLSAEETARRLGAGQATDSKR